MSHFILDYANRVNAILHGRLYPTLCYRHEIYDVQDLLTALIVTYDDVVDDEFIEHSDTTWEAFLARMSRVKPDWAHFSMEVMQQVGSMVMAGWEGRTIYFIRHAQYPGSWTSEQAGIDVALLLAASRMVWGPMVLNELEAFASSVPTGREHFRDFERLVRVTFTFLFPEHLGEPRIQSRTEPGNESCEIRDVIFPNKSETGFWQDLKAKYSCTEIVIDAKNSMEITQDDLRQVYCYLKPAIGLWGFIVCRAPDIDTFQKYNRTLFKNFCQTRGVLLLSVCDLIAMARIRLHGNEPSEYLRSKMSKFLQSI